MNNKTITTILCLAIIGAFFLPYLANEGMSFSGYDLVFGKYGVKGIAGKGNLIFISLLVPIGALLVLLGALTRDNYGNSTFIRSLPLLGLVYMMVMVYMVDSATISVSEMIGFLSYGFWITLAAAVALPFFKTD